jgi:hypothetical protein
VQVGPTTLLREKPFRRRLLPNSLLGREVKQVLDILLLIVLATSIWAALDAQALIAKGADRNSLGGGPAAIFVGCLLLWIVVFPYYLVKRSKINGGSAGSSTILPVIIVGSVIFIALYLVLTRNTTTDVVSPLNSGSSSVTYSVSAVGSSQAIDVTYETGSGEAQQSDVTLPFSITVTNVNIPVLVAQNASGSSGTSISCEIDISGQTPIQNTSTGPYTVASCS